MTQMILSREARRNVSFFSDSSGVGFGTSVKLYDDAGDKLIGIENLPIFRSGSFRDSLGFQHLWEDIHIDQMVTNFEFLKNRLIFDDVPVRAGHPGFLGNPVKEVIGYIESLHKEVMTSPHDGKTYSYLFASFSIIDDEASLKIDNGLWKNRSAEIGPYITNDEMELWPTIMGFAYVDIPAVEGLKFSKYTPSTHSILFDTELKEIPKMPNKAEGSAGEPPQNINSGSITPPPPLPPIPGGQSVQSGQVIGKSDLANSTGPHLTFTIAGVQTNDFQAVQNHIDSLQGRVNVLENAAREQAEVTRKEFVNSLLASNKIISSQVEPLQKLVVGMSDEQFSLMRDSYGDVSPVPVLGHHAVNNHSGQQSAPSGSPDLAPEIIQAREIVYRHKITGMNIEQLKKTSSFRLLVANNAVPSNLLGEVNA